MALSCAAEYALSVACARWAVRRRRKCVLARRLVRLLRAHAALAAYDAGDEHPAPTSPLCPPYRLLHDAPTGRSCSPCAASAWRGPRTTASCSTPAGPSLSREGTRTAGCSAPPCGCSTGRAPRCGGWWRRPGQAGAGSCSWATRSARAWPCGAGSGGSGTAAATVFHIVEWKNCRCERFPPQVRTVVPTEGRFELEHVVLSCNAAADHGIIWIGKEFQKALDLMEQEEQRSTSPPSQQKMLRAQSLNTKEGATDLDSTESQVFLEEYSLQVRYWRCVQISCRFLRPHPFFVQISKLKPPAPSPSRPMQTPLPAMGERGDKSDYESLREARISENQARMETLGLRRAVQELNEMAAAAAPARRPWIHKKYATGPPRRSPRLNRQSVHHKALPLKGCLGKVMALAVEEANEEEKKMQQEEEEQQAAAAVGEDMALALQDSDNEGMGAVYDEAVPGSPVQPAGGRNGASTRIESAGTDT